VVLNWFRRAGWRVLAFPHQVKLLFFGTLLIVGLVVSVINDLRAPSEPVRFSAMGASTLPNAWLVCPADVCPSADVRSVVYRVSAARLASEWEATVAARQRVTRVRRDDDGLGGTWIQESAVFGFRDRINMRIYSRGEALSTIAVHSRSEFGLYDFGVNRRRVEEWLAHLANLSNVPPPFRLEPEFAPERPEVAPLR